MFELIVKKSNGEFHWREHFNSLEDAQKWIREEQTRSYWDKSLIFEITDKTPPLPSQAEIDSAATKKDQIKNLKARVKNLTAQPDMTPAELKEAVMKFLKIKDLQSEFDEKG
jgi:hypothetical protein